MGKTMIISVTPNTAIDYSYRVPEFSLGRTIRALESAWGMGGKAADAAWILGRWGIKNLVLGFAAGPNGHRMEAMLRERGCQTDFVWVNGETRLNTVICSRGKHSTFTSSTIEVTPEHVDAFYGKYHLALEKATCLVLGGSLPKGVPSDFFADVIRLAWQRGIPVIFDSSGSYLRKGLEAHPTVIKPNLAELIDLSREVFNQTDTVKSVLDRKQVIYSLTKQVQSQYGVSIVVTLGNEGAMALFGDTHYWIPSLEVEVVSAAGAGDAVLAGLAVAYSQHLPIEDGLRLGFALAASVLLTLATADYHPDDVKAFIPLIELRPLSAELFAAQKQASFPKREAGLAL
jgi:1-phosphofructokinase family hexose kinase